MEVRIRGVTGELRDNVRASVTLERRRQQKGLGAAAIRQLHAQAPGDQFDYLLFPGYQAPDVGRRDSNPSKWKPGVLR